MSKLEVGDVFLVPVDGEQYGVGQLAGNWKGELYVVIFDKLVSRNASPSDTANADLQFAALTLDAKFHHGDWPVIGNRTDNLADIPQPWFKVGVGNATYIEARNRTVSRRATASEESALRYRTVVAPVRIENALKALHGIGDWNPRFEQLRADYTKLSSKLVGGQSSCSIDDRHSAVLQLGDCATISHRLFEKLHSSWSWRAICSTTVNIGEDRSIHKFTNPAQKRARSLTRNAPGIPLGHVHALCEPKNARYGTNTVSTASSAISG
nr:Imm26 family immunity protein [uncultured Sphingomonas sp.]